MERPPPTAPSLRAASARSAPALPGGFRLSHIRSNSAAAKPPRAEPRAPAGRVGIVQQRHVEQRGVAALVLIALAREYQANWIALDATALHEDFYRLESGLAGDVVQKPINYGLNLCIIGNIDTWLAHGNALSAFVRKSNRGQSVWFVASEAALLLKLEAHPLPVHRR